MKKIIIIYILLFIPNILLGATFTFHNDSDRTFIYTLEQLEIGIPDTSYLAYGELLPYETQQLKNDYPPNIYILRWKPKEDNCIWDEYYLNLHDNINNIDIWNNRVGCYCSIKFVQSLNMFEIYAPKIIINNKGGETQ